MKKKIFSLIIILITFFCPFINVSASSLGISASSKSVVTNGSVTITVNASGLIGKFSITSSNGNILSGGTSSVWLENESQSYKFSAKNVGSATITIKALDVSDSNGNPYSGSKSITINVVKPREKSTNNNLKSLSVEGYELSPSFDKNVLEYTVNLESNVEKITINASKEDGYASINGTGEKEVQEGDNNFEITVTSETGSSKVYKINAIVKDSNPIIKTIDDKEYTVIKRASTLEKPEDFEETTVTIDNTEIPAFYNEKTNITLIGLKDAEGINYLFRYNSQDNTYIKYQFLTSVSQTIIFEDTKEEIPNYEKKEVTIDNQKYMVYQNSKNKDYVLIYGMNLETGSKNWYLYNINEKSIQTYMKDIIEDMNHTFDNKIKEYKIVLLGMAGLSLFLLCMILLEIASKNKMKKKYLQKIQNIKESKQEIKMDKEEEKKTDNKKKKKRKQELDEDLW